MPSSGQASSHAGFIYYSGGATLAVNNTYKPADPGPLHKYEYVSFTKVMRLDPNTEDWSQVRHFLIQQILIVNVFQIVPIEFFFPCHQFMLLLLTTLHVIFQLI